ncbi:hypothetical protein H6P81_021151 [Aristolochia fimbriata]|uniref:Uncharacterized protein n=1 Tax=Aristolochia fimbriata TaxID=158543 RepID=A0AAV7DRJ7_ARIFI|nr:hypothetical protein H6P81_021151 [Aristolochia fimbriata]
MVAPGGSGTGSSRGGSYRSPASRWGANPEQPWRDFGPPRLLPGIAQTKLGEYSGYHGRSFEYSAQ